jgi:ribosomal protein S18 acetylase RimI-like enzyme
MRRLGGVRAGGRGDGIVGRCGSRRAQNGELQMQRPRIDMTTLRPMSPAEYQRWRALAVAEYAAEKVRNGRWTEAESASEAEKEFAALLPAGLQTEGHLLYTIGDGTGSEEDVCVGAAWLARASRADPAQHPTGYVYDLVVWPEHRRRGHAEATLRALELEVQRLGWKGLALHVFGHNHAALALYRKQGFVPTNLNLFKPVPPAQGALPVT